MVASLTIPDFFVNIDSLWYWGQRFINHRTYQKKKKKFRAATSLAVCFNKPPGSANHRGENKGYVPELLGRYINYASVSFAV